MEILTPIEVSKQLKKSIRWVYANGSALGGVKIGGSWIFTKENLHHAYKQKDGKWRATVMVNGERSNSLQDTKKQAVKWEVAERKRLKRLVKKRRLGTDLLTLSSKYLDHAENQFTVKVYKEKKRLCKTIIILWGQDILIKEISPEMIFDYLKEQKDTRSAKAANKDRKNLSALFSWGQEIFGYDEIPFNPVKRVKKFKHQVRIPETYTEDEILKLLIAATR
jgi:hypothetical protein